ncbi:MAG TPA: EamA family transporter [Anaerolineae bacterium]|nr:EamA family transporter [Anaerolineae bacterium]
MNRRALGALFAFTAAAIWGGMYVVTDVVLEVVPPATLLVLRYALALTALLGAFWVARDRGIARRDWGEIVVIACVGFGVSLLAQFGGTALSTAAAGAVITSATPAFIILFAWPLLRELPSSRQLAGLALATIGVLVVSLLGDQPASERSRDPVLGNLLLIVAAISWALYTVLARRATQRYTPLAVTLGVTLAGIPIVAPIAGIELQTQPIGDLTPGVIAGILYVGIGSTAIAFYLWNKSFELLDAATASLFFFAQPVVGTLLSSIFLRERLPAPFFAGSALVVLGVLLAIRDKPRARIDERVSA